MKPWVLHTTLVLGNLTDRWIDGQAARGERYDARLGGLRVAPGLERRPHWVVMGDRPDRKLAFLSMNKSGGLSMAWLAGRFRRERPALLHFHYGNMAAQERWLARSLSRRFVTSFYGFDATRADLTGSRLWQGRYRRLFRDTSAVIAEGPAMAARIEALGCPADKLEVVRLPADAEALDGIERERSDDFLVAVAGRFDHKKGFDTAIRAFARGLKGRADARLLMIGGGELEADYRRIVEEEGIGDQVEWGGRLPFDEFMGAVSRARLALYPSRAAPDGDSEGGAPVTLIEAQWLGVPSLVSDHDDLSFAAGPEGAVVLEPRAVDDWAEVLRELHDDPARLEGMSRAAREFVRSHHSPERNVKAREEIYDRFAAR